MPQLIQSPSSSSSSHWSSCGGSSHEHERESEASFSLNKGTNNLLTPSIPQLLLALLLLLHSVSCVHGVELSSNGGSGDDMKLTLERSFDLGSTWQVHSAPLSSASAVAASPSSAILLRIRDTQSPMIEVPACAIASRSLVVTAWYESSSIFALSWASKSCEEGNGEGDGGDNDEKKVVERRNDNDNNNNNNDGDYSDENDESKNNDEMNIKININVQRKLVPRSTSRWMDYISYERRKRGHHRRGSEGEEQEQEQDDDDDDYDEDVDIEDIDDMEEVLQQRRDKWGRNKKNEKQGWFAKYGLYIGLFIAFALGQGIRQGYVELREEAERAEAAEREQVQSQRRQLIASGRGAVAASTRVTSQQQPQQVHLRERSNNRPTLRARKRGGGKSASSSSSTSTSNNASASAAKEK